MVRRKIVAKLSMVLMLSHALGFAGFGLGWVFFLLQVWASHTFFVSLVICLVNRVNDAGWLQENVYHNRHIQEAKKCQVLSIVEISHVIDVQWGMLFSFLEAESQSVAQTPDNSLVKLLEVVVL